jgi:pimeloyl-ACP methyl ester carboxylesterase
MIDVPSGQVAALDTGPAGDPPTVLMVPGYTGSKEDFGPLLDPLAAAGRRVVAIDLPGQYESPGPDDTAWYTVDHLGAVLLEVADAVGGPIQLVGHSFGGLVSRSAVIAAPGRFRSLTLMDSGPAAIGGQRDQMLVVAQQIYQQGGIEAVYQVMEQLAQGDPNYLAQPVEVREFLRGRFVANVPAGLLGMGEALRSEPDRVDELRAAAPALPLLVLCGAAADAWAPATQAAMAARLGAEHVVIPDAVHSPAIENTAPTLAALRAFWDRVEAGA